jgi:hypothetical protein
MQETIFKFLGELFSSDAFQNALMTIITSLFLIVGAKLQSFLNQLIEREKLRKLSTLRNYVGDVSKDLIVSAEKRVIDGDDKEQWVVDLLKFQFADYVEDKTLSDDDLKSIVRGNYEELRSEISDKRWDDLGQKGGKKKLKVKSDELKVKSQKTKKRIMN